MQSIKTVEGFIEKQSQWKEPLQKFRKIFLETELLETIKWGVPVYTLNSKNVLGMGAFKSYVGIWFFQGTFLKDPHKRLVNAQEGKTKALRQLRFTSIEVIDYDLVKEYVAEAIQTQKEGKEIKPEKNKPLIIPDELLAKFEVDEELKKCFGDLTLSKQREYSEYISDAKREETKQKRPEKIIPMIKEKIGMSDRYKRK